MIKLRITLESKQDVIREIEINSDLNLEQFHAEIINYFGLDKFEMASFYMTDSNLNLGQEIPLFKIDEKDSSMLDMSKITIASVFLKIDSQLIYVYNFLKMWRFLVSYSKETKKKSEKIEVINSIGKMPKEAPEIIFEAEKEDDSFKDLGKNLGKELDKFNDSEY